MRKPRLVFGFLRDCGHCHVTRPAVRALARELPNVELIESDIDGGGTFPAPVEGFPAVALVGPDGKVAGVTVGQQSTKQLRAWLWGIVGGER